MLLLTHRNAGIFLIFIFFILFTSCKKQDKKIETYRVGFSQCVENDVWRKSMLAEMKMELAFHPEIEFFYKQAGNSSTQQIKDVKDLINDGIDLLIISPNEAQPLTPIVEEVFSKGIPVIVVDRKTSSDRFTNYIGADNFQIGKMAGEYVGSVLKGAGNVMEVIGLSGSSPAIERDRGFRQAISKFPEIKLLKSVNGDWVKTMAKEALAEEKSLLPKTDLIFAHNDVMAFGIYEACISSGNPKIKIIGVDALPTKGAGMEAIEDKTLTASFLYPTGGAESIKNAIKILNSQPLEKQTILQTLVVDSSNVRMMKLQSDKILSQQGDIEQQQQMNIEQRRIYNNQRTFVYFLICSLGLSIIFAGLLYHSWHVNKKINRKLALQNEEISHKSELLLEMSQKAQAAHEDRLNFFTNISHEFRTPLTLLIGPIEEMINHTKTPGALQKQLGMMRKNVVRLLKLVNQLIDFRKVEFKKMKVKASEVDLVAFTNEVVQAFQDVAGKRNIDCRLLTKERMVQVWIDTTMMDKVLFNLLSNAFKFTGDNGAVLVSIEKDIIQNKVVINIEDTGIGMSKEELDHLFEIFYQGDFDNHKGSGLGLALSKELMQLHNGNIEVESKKGKGTILHLTIPLGKDHLSKEEILDESLSRNFVDEQGQLFTSDLYPTVSEMNTQLAIEGVLNETTILVIEDNPELRTFIQNKLCVSYQIIEAENGIEGMKQAFDNLPDLIICDIMMPGKDGITLIKQLKGDVRTAHIPIILLSAKVTLEEQVEGLKHMADAYFTKPFNFTLLEHTLKSILGNRIKIREHYSSDISTGICNQVVNKTDKKFITNFKGIVESNISNDQFTIEDICKEMNISKVHLYRKIKALLNMNINEYILHTRIQKACYYLQHEDLTISEVAYQTGFGSHAYFSTVFKAKTGISPTHYKDRRN